MSKIVDYYPMETKSFNALPQDHPLQEIAYGGILTLISELVKEKRKKNRDERRKFLIKKINNVNLDTLVKEIQLEAKDLESYVRKKWTKGPINKVNLLKFFESHDISLKYLEDMYELQSKGAPAVKDLDIIKLSDGNYGLVVNSSYTNIRYVSVVDYGNDFYMPYRCKWNDGYNSYPYSINIWKCNVVSHMTDLNLLKYNDIINRYNADMELRNKFWLENPILNTHMIPYAYFHYTYDIMNGEIPPIDIQYFGDYELWNLFKGCINKDICSRMVDETIL
jgi:hypothetical protein